MVKGLLAGVAMVALASAAEAQEWSLAGHQVTLEKLDEGGYRLVADGVVMLEDGLILSDDGAEVYGGAMVYGVAGAGGNACDASPFVLWLPEGAAPRLDGPIETCSILTPDFTGGQIAWTSESLPGRLTEHWVWRAADGIEAAPSTPFAPDAGRGWEEVATLQEAHPVEAVRLEPVWTALEQGLSPEDLQELGERLSGLGSGGLVGQDYFGEACIKEVCDTDFAGIWLDAGRQQVFAFWAETGKQGLRYFPLDPGLWPQGALDKLAEHGG